MPSPKEILKKATEERQEAARNQAETMRSALGINTSFRENPPEHKLYNNQENINDNDPQNKILNVDLKPKISENNKKIRPQLNKKGKVASVDSKTINDSISDEKPHSETPSLYYSLPPSLRKYLARNVLYRKPSALILYEDLFGMMRFYKKGIFIECITAHQIGHILNKSEKTIRGLLRALQRSNPPLISRKSVIDKNGAVIGIKIKLLTNKLPDHIQSEIFHIFNIDNKSQ